MFEQLFSPRHPKVLARHREGPLAEDLIRYLDHLAKQGVPSCALRLRCWYLRAATKWLRLAERPHDAISHAEVERQGVRWVKRSRKGFKWIGSDKLRKRFVRFVTEWLQFLGRLELRPIAPRRFAKQILAFSEYRRQEQGLAMSTVLSESHRIQKFLDRLGRSVRTLKNISITHIDNALIEQVTHSGYSRRTISTLAGCLRVFSATAKDRVGAVTVWRRQLRRRVSTPKSRCRKGLPGIRCRKCLPRPKVIGLQISVIALSCCCWPSMAFELRRSDDSAWKTSTGKASCSR